MVAKKKASKKKVTTKKKRVVKRVTAKKKVTTKKKATTKRKTRATKKKAAPKRKVAAKKKATTRRKAAPKKKTTTKRKVATKKVTPKKKATRKKKVVVAKTNTPKKKSAVRKKPAPKEEVKKVVKRRKTTNYLNNRDMLAEVIESKRLDEPTPKLANMFMLLVARYGKKYSYANYTYNDDMQAYALMMLVKTWRSFRPEKSSNPFAFFTQCIKNSFIQYLNQEKKQRNIRDEILVDKGLTPSYTYQLEHEQKSRDRTLSDDETCQTDHVGVGEAREEPAV